MTVSVEENQVWGALVPVAGQEEVVRDRFWVKVRRTLGRVPFLDDALAAYYAAMDPATPARVKAVLFAALAYFVLPADLIPDFLAGFGFTDDATVLLTAMQLLSPHIKSGHKDQARHFLRAGHPDAESAGV